MQCQGGMIKTCALFQLPLALASRHKVPPNRRFSCMRLLVATRSNSLNESAPRVVFSSESGRLCPDCAKAIGACVCAALKKLTVPQGGTAARVKRENKGRGGKTVTVVTDLPLNAIDLEALGKKLRTRCSAGGTTRDGVIEVQGDHVETVFAFLVAEGFKVKK
jgi:translation initiation factor 1